MAAPNLAYARDGSTLGGSIAEDAAIAWAYYTALHELPADADTHQAYEAGGQRLAQRLHELELTSDDLKRQAKEVLKQLGQRLPAPMPVPTPGPCESQGNTGDTKRSPAVIRLSSRRRTPS